MRTVQTTTARPTTTEGIARVVVRADDGVTRLADLHQKAPLRLLFPRISPEEPLIACLTNTGGGVVGGDRLTVQVRVGRGARLMVMAQAAEKVYRSAGLDSTIDVALSAEPGAWLEWLPQETILFDGARLRRRTRLEIGRGARALAGEILVFGRIAHGEVVRNGLTRDAWEVRLDGRLAWADALHLEGDLRAVLDHPAAFGGARASATLVFHAEGLDALRDALREPPLPAGVLRGVTLLRDLLLVRWLATDALALRRDFADTWTRIRGAHGFPAGMPRLWYV